MSTNYKLINTSSNTSTWTGATSTWTGTGTIINTPLNTTILDSNSTFYYTPTTPNYSDLFENLKPGTEWHPCGTIVRLRQDFVMWKGFEEFIASYHSIGEIFSYLGVVEDLSAGKERHLFLSSAGIVQFVGMIYDLSWRAIARSHFVVSEG